MKTLIILIIHPVILDVRLDNNHFCTNLSCYIMRELTPSLTFSKMASPPTSIALSKKKDVTTTAKKKVDVLLKRRG